MLVKLTFELLQAMLSQAVLLVGQLHFLSKPSMPSGKCVSMFVSVCACQFSYIPYISNLKRGIGRLRGQNCTSPRQGVVSSFILWLVFLERHSVEIAVEIVQKLCTMLILEPVLLVGEEQGVMVH